MQHQKPPEICPVCKEKADFKFVQDYKNEEREWSLYECSKCQVQFWNPFKSPGREWYESLPESAMRSVAIMGDIKKPKIVRIYHKTFLKFCKNFPKGIKILELGCGSGELLAILQQQGFEVWGVDFIRKAIEIAENHYKLKNVYAMSCDEFFKLQNLPKFDLITFFELIEHLDNPLEFIQNVNKLIKEDGLIVLSTPSRERILVNSTKGDCPPPHLSRWNETAISNLFRKIDFKIVRVDYVEQFQLILWDAILERFRFGLVIKTVKLSKNKESTAPRATFLTKIVHLAAYLKDYFLYFLCGFPVAVLFLIGKLKSQKNGGMLIWLKRLQPTHHPLIHPSHPK